jgi:flavin reductase (DIM6/NTAB) family NADH-FMN oxidoreductase RutF
MMTDFDSRTFRAACGSFATGVAVITAKGAEGELVGFTANSFTSVSLDPALVLFSLGREANCLPTFEKAGHFAINILAEDQRALSQRFADPDSDKWEGIAFDLWTTGAPIIEGTLANLECRTETVLDGGDHRLFLGRVLRLGCREGRPLLFFRGAYHALGPGLGEPEHPAEPVDGTHLAGVEPSFTA